MKNLFILIPAILCGCVTHNHNCAVMEFNHKPDAITVNALAKCANETPATIKAWFDAGNDGFVINTTNTQAASDAYQLSIQAGAIEISH